MPDKLEMQVTSLDKRVNSIEKLMQKAPAPVDIPALVKRVDALDKSIEQLKAIAAQLGKSLESKKDQASVEQLAQKQAEKEARKIVDDLKLQAKDLQLESRIKVIETKLEIALRAAQGAAPR